MASVIAELTEIFPEALVPIVIKPAVIFPISAAVNENCPAVFVPRLIRLPEAGIIMTEPARVAFTSPVIERLGDVT